MVSVLGAQWKFSPRETSIRLIQISKDKLKNLWSLIKGLTTNWEVFPQKKIYRSLVRVEGCVIQDRDYIHAHKALHPGKTVWASLSVEWQFPSPLDPWSARAILSYFSSWWISADPIFHSYRRHLSSGWQQPSSTYYPTSISCSTGSVWTGQLVKCAVPLSPTAQCCRRPTLVVLPLEWKLSSSPGSWNVDLVWGGSLAGEHPP